MSAATALAVGLSVGDVRGYRIDSTCNQVAEWHHVTKSDDSPSGCLFVVERAYM